VRGLDSLRYQTAEIRPGPQASDELLLVNVRYKQPGESESRILTQPVRDVTRPASTDLRFAAAVAAWGMLLRESPFVGTFGLADVVELAREALGEDREGHRAEFIELVERTRTLELLGVAAGPGEPE
jgi:Ca-activated chloride channel family protein